jgi:O-methyltransferase involved in polyketide biosynthesis
VARVYDYWLGGKDNFAADRELAEKLLEIYPPAAEMAWQNRQFLARAVRWVASKGVTQFLDLGAGLPTSPNTHEAALSVNPDARIAYVDNDPVAAMHQKTLVAKGSDAIIAIEGDLRDSSAILSAPQLRGFLDFGEPVCVILGLVLHFLTADAGRELVSQYVSALAPGSYVIITVSRGDGEAADRWFSSYSAATMYNHSHGDYTGFFTGLEVVPPGLVEAAVWQGGLAEVAPPERRSGQVLAGIVKVRAG